jgi:hypothetical protein
MKALYRTGLAALAMTMITGGCRKGEGDPLLSLAGRKARMENTWQLKEGVVRQRYVEGGKAFERHITIADKKYNLSETDTATGVMVARGWNEITMTLDMSRKGEFTLSEWVDGEEFRGSGYWDFHDGVGEEKKKANIFMKLEKVTKRDSYHSVLFMNGMTEANYYIRHLSGDRMVLTAGKSTYLNVNGDSDDLEVELIFTE